MQRSITDQKLISSFLYTAAFALYIGLSSIYLFLPPLLAVLFALMAKAFKRNDSVAIAFISVCLLIFEAEKGYILFSSIIYFLVIYKFVLPRLEQNFNCKVCMNIAITVLAYFGFWVFNLILAQVFLLPMPTIDFYIIYYILIEFLMVSIL